MEAGVSIVIPAYNEEKTVEEATQSVLRALYGVTTDYEIILVDDGSRDKTKEIADKIAKRNKRIRVIHHPKNLGFGASFRDGVFVASKAYLAGFPGDNDMSWKALRQLIKEREEADLITSYMINSQQRGDVRRGISLTFVLLMNLLFNLRLRYYNGYFLCKTELLKSLSLKSEGYMLMAEIKVRLLKKGATFKEIPFEHTGRKGGKSKALTLKSFWRLFLDLRMLVRDIYFA